MLKLIDPWRDILPSDLMYAPERYCGLRYWKPEKADKTWEYQFGALAKYAKICQIVQFPSCCGLGVIHEMVYSDALECFKFTGKQLAEDLRTFMWWMREHMVWRHHMIAVTLDKRYQMWEEAFTLLGGKVTSTYINQNSNNLNKYWEIPFV